MTTYNIVNKHNLNIANRFINDDVPTIALEVDVNSADFNLKLTN